MRDSVLVLGQTPPPWHGQAVMIDALLRGETPRLVKHHVPLAFSRTDTEIGRISARKLMHLMEVRRAIVQAHELSRARVLYYPPAGPSLVPVLRDAALLLATRRRFERTVLHFHAAGLGEFLSSLPEPLRTGLRRAYQAPDRAIVLGEHGRPDAEAIGAREVRVVPYGIPDVSPPYASVRSAVRSGSGRALRLLYVGALRESKGVLDLVEAVGRLRRQGRAIELDLVGAWASDLFQVRLGRLLEGEAALPGAVRHWGSLSGDAKWRRYAEADLFCFPSFYEAESLPVVLLEALQFGLPVVATRWRGIPSIVDDGVNGLLVPPRDSDALTDAIERLVTEPETRRRMGDAAREAYERRFTLGRYLESMEDALSFS